MNVAVLGATGFIGGHIARACVAAGWRVQALRRRPGSYGHIAELPVDWIDGDLNEPAAVARVLSGCQVAFHAAAFYPAQRAPVPRQVAQGVAEMRAVLAVARSAQLERFVYTSSLTTIGRPPAATRLADERDFYLPGSWPQSGYYEAKFAMEAEAFRACLAGLPVVILNPTAVFGPGDVKPTLGRVLLALAQGWGWGWIDATINVVDVREVALAHVTAATSGRVGERYLVGGHNLPVRELMAMVARLANARPPRFRVPAWVLRRVVAIGDFLPFLPLPVNHLRAVPYWQPLNCQKAWTELGVQPRPFEQTVADALDWFRVHGYY